MAHVSFNELRRNLEKHLDRVENDRLELVVTRRNHEDMVIMPLADFDAIRKFIGEVGAGLGDKQDPAES